MGFGLMLTSGNWPTLNCKAGMDFGKNSKVRTPTAKPKHCSSYDKAALTVPPIRTSFRVSCTSYTGLEKGDQYSWLSSLNSPLSAESEFRTTIKHSANLQHPPLGLKSANITYFGLFGAPGPLFRKEFRASISGFWVQV